MIIVIPGRFASLNEWVDANRRKKYTGNSMKQKDQKIICQYLPSVRFKGSIFLTYTFYEPNTRRDKDNISGYFHKVFQDALVQAGVIENDAWRNISGMTDYFMIDKKFPRIEIQIEEDK